MEYLQSEEIWCKLLYVTPWILDLNKILIYNSVVRNSRTFLLSPNLQRNIEVHKTLTQICICGTVLIVAVSASLTNDGNLSHFDFKSHTYSVPPRWILPTLQCNYNIFSVGNQTKWESSRKIYHSLPVLHITFKYVQKNIAEFFKSSVSQKGSVANDFSNGENKCL